MDLPEKLTLVATIVAVVVGLAGAIPSALYLKDGKREGGQINRSQSVSLPLFLTASLPSREARQLVIDSRPLLQVDHLSFFCGYEPLHALSFIVTSLHYRNFDLPYPRNCWRLSRSR